MTATATSAIGIQYNYTDNAHRSFKPFNPQTPMKFFVQAITALRKAAAPALIITCVAMSLGFTSYQGGKVTICHVPPGNPANRHTIQVSMNALQAHLAHGDYIGTCEDEKEEPGNGNHSSDISHP